MVNPVDDGICLEVALAYQDPISNLRIVRLPAQVMFQLDVLMEDVVQVEGGPLLAKMDVLVWAAYPEDTDRLIVRINKSVMDYLEIKEGELVKVRLSQFQLQSKQRKEHSLHHNKNVRVLTIDDLVAAEITEVDNALAKHPKNAGKADDIILVPDRDGTILYVGEEVDVQTDKDIPP